MPSGKNLLASAMAAIAIVSTGLAVAAPAGASTQQAGVQRANPTQPAAPRSVTGVPDTWILVDTYPTYKQCKDEGRSSAQPWNCKPSVLITDWWDLFIRFIE
ncbi:hypothetical protein [Actinomadura fibrosa]|uniref:Secreted protein n=1 Tax=Actinomadura fibrosa TaxID=111802 RepID=A0ABW2Y1I9_9ACTN|nr:hypothetical protein [Actinomadura fibrosa]